MRPETSAFRELEALVHNLGEQLAGYRKRALAGEKRVRELEAKTSADAGALRELRTELERVGAEREIAVSEVSRAKSEISALRSQFDQAAEEWTKAALKATPEGVDQELSRENEHLKALLEDARTRTTALVERFRFLRQQVGHGGAD